MAIETMPQPEPVAEPPAKPPVAELQSFIRFCRRAFPEVERRVPGVTAAESRILRLLAAKPKTPARAAARKLGLDEARMSRLVKQLLQRGLIDRLPVWRHGEPRPLILTEAGRKIASRALHAEHTLLSHRLEQLLPNEQAELKAAMKRVRELVG